MTSPASAPTVPAKTTPQPETTNLLLSTVAINMLSLALPIMTLQVYDRILPNPDSGTLPVLITGVCIAIILETVLRLCRSWMIGWSSAVYEHSLSEKVMDHILHADASHFKCYNAGEHLHRLAAIGKMKDFHNGYALVTLTELLFVPIFLGIIFYIAPPLTIVPAALLALFVFIALIQGRALQREIDNRDKIDDARYDFLIECLKGIHTIKAFAMERLFVRRYESLQEKTARATLTTSEAAADTFDTGTSLSHVMIAAVITVGAVFVLQGQITTGALIATLLLSGRMMQSLQRVLALWAKYQDYTLSKKKVASIFNIPLHHYESAADLPAPAGHLDLRHVKFRYSKEDKYLLDDISLDLKCGESIALSGGYGCGKSTLLELIAGLYPAQEGDIDIDGMGIKYYPPSELIRHVGYMPAEAVIFRGTIRDNITCFGEIPEQAAREIAALLHVDKDVAKLPAGFDTMLNTGTNGNDSIPPGLRQRIAMTRILATKPKILLFDEADRSLDHDGYNRVFSLLARLNGKVAMILVSDDENITALATRRYRLENGKLVEKPSRRHPASFDSTNQNKE